MRYLVNITLGVCECTVNNTGAPRQHQFVLCSSKKFSCPIFLPLFHIENRQRPAETAIGSSLDGPFYEMLHDRIRILLAHVIGDNEVATEFTN